MKRRFWYCAAFILACLFFLPAAFAEDVRITLEADPDELTEAGDVQLTFDIANYSDYELHNITITAKETQYGQTEQVIVPQNGSVQVHIQYRVSEAELGSKIAFTVAWTQDGEPREQQVSIVIIRAVEPEITFSVKADVSEAETGEAVSFVYTLKNETKYDMSGITIADDGLSGSTILSAGVLLAGGTMTLPYYTVMGESDLVSNPTIIYTVNGKSKTMQLQAVQVTRLLVELTVHIAEGTPTAEGVPFTIEIINTGNQTVSNIQMMDERGNKVNDTAFSLEPSDSITMTYLVQPITTEELRELSFTLTGMDPRRREYAPELNEIFPIRPFIDDSQINVTITAVILDEWSANTGTVRVRITISNLSAVVLTNAVFSEISLGTVYEIETLSEGETVFDRELTMGSPRNLSFTLKAQDPTETERTLATCSLAVAYPASSTPSLIATPAPTELPQVISIVSDTLIRVLTILGVIMVIAFIALVVITVIEKRASDRIEENSELDSALNAEDEILPLAYVPIEISEDKTIIRNAQEGQNKGAIDIEFEDETDPLEIRQSFTALSEEDVPIYIGRSVTESLDRGNAAPPKQFEIKRAPAVRRYLRNPIRQVHTMTADSSVKKEDEDT